MNNITIVGRVGRDPELRFSKDEKPIAVFSVATDYGRDENKKTSWHNIVAFGSLAENVIKSIHTGTRVIVSGRLDVSDYQTKDGEKKKKHEDSDSSSSDEEVKCHKKVAPAPIPPKADPQFSDMVLKLILDIIKPK